MIQKPLTRERSACTLPAHKPFNFLSKHGHELVNACTLPQCAILALPRDKSSTPITPQDIQLSLRAWPRVDVQQITKTCDPCFGLVTNSIRQPVRQPPTASELRAWYTFLSTSVWDRSNLSLGLGSSLDTCRTIQLSVKLEKLAHRVFAATLFQVAGVL